MTQRTAKPEENIGSYKIDPTKKPKTIDLMGDAKSSVGIYELRDDSLRICLRQGGRELLEREQDYARRIRLFFDLPEHFQPSHLGHENIQEDQVGAQAGYLMKSSCPDVACPTTGGAQGTSARLTWTALGWILHQMLFYPAATELFFSRREEEATYLLGQERLRGMWQRLPGWLKDCTGAWPRVDSMTTWALENGSVARAFPSNAGDSYAATTAFCDEFDLIDEKGQSRLLRSVKPTIDNGGRLILLSRPDKSKPSSAFKRIYQAAKSVASSWEPFFAAWDTHPGRDQGWYDAQRADILDDLHEQYPASDTEALAARTLDKRFAPAWLEACYQERQPIVNHSGPAIPALCVFVPPRTDGRYVIGADPAEGNPTSDESAACVLDSEKGIQVAVLAGRIEPSVFAAYLGQVSVWYNRARSWWSGKTTGTQSCWLCRLGSAS